LPAGFRLAAALPRAGNKGPEEIVVLDKFPQTATGKLDRTALKQMAEQNLAR
jgi:acyl-CoA synthetase (AMP-forming)/AMP-acid ligase II